MIGIRDIPSKHLHFKMQRAYLIRNFKTSNDEIDDVIQTVYLELLKMNKQVEDIRHFNNLFTQMCRNRFINKIQRSIKVSRWETSFVDYYNYIPNSIKDWECNYDANIYLDHISKRKGGVGNFPKHRVEVFEKILDYGGRGEMQPLMDEVGINKGNFNVTLNSVRKDIQKTFF